MTTPDDVSFGRETLKGVAARLAMYLFGFAATAYFARELGPAVFGGFFLLLSVVQFANRVPHGLGGACQKRLAEVDTSNEELLGLTLGATVACGTVAATLAFVGRDLLIAYTGIPNAPVLAVALFVSMSTFLPLQFLLAGTGRFGVTHWIDLGREVLKTVLQFGLVVLGFGVTGMTAGFVVATLCFLPVLFWLLGLRPAVPTRATAVRVWEYARYNVPTNIVGKAYTRFDVFLLGWVGLTASVGFYEVALSVTGLATLVSGVVMDGLISKVSDLSSRDLAIGETVTAAISYTSAIAIPLLVIVVFLGDAVVEAIYGSAYAATVPLLGGIAVYRILQTQREPLDSAVKGMGRPDTAFRISAVTVAVNFALGVPLVLTVGPIGVIAATIAAESLRWDRLHRALRRNGATVPRFPDPLRIQFRSAAGMAAVVAGLTRLGSAPGPGEVALVSALGVATYLTLLLAQDRRARRTVVAAALAARGFLGADEPVRAVH
ncbi:lipopolysaccharide biosynthesis protein [Halovivax limisalsi]|uniref:lipopolysaccharide biosynthesis protein n=1 Tax=Halovivax limisalsi TaxID=1453760 RepID=UPI001FFD74A3|nr:oligosaccharide flippase family protein [Halovivax limisalsi]